MIISRGQNVFAVEVEALIACCKERITGFKVPRKILWTDAPLPRTPSGKVTKFVLVDQYSSK